jgi:hypothetical protein
MQVPRPSQQHAVMIEAVENHMPEVIVIDEIGTELEAQAARTIAERGVQLIGTAHGNTLENLMLNPTLADLIGGIQSVTLSDEEARRRGTQKSVLERKAPPTFTVLVEIQDRDRVAIHRDVAASVDAILRGQPLAVEVRRRSDDGGIEVTQQSHDEAAALAALGRRRDERAAGGFVMTAGRRGGRQGAATPPPRPLALAEPEPAAPPASRHTPARPLRVYPFGVSRNRLEQVAGSLGVPAALTRDLRDADVVVTLKNYYRRRPQQLQEAEALGKPVYVLRSNTATQMETVLAGIFGVPAHPAAAPGGRPDAPAPGEEDAPDDDVATALYEAETAAGRVLNSAQPVALSPQTAYIRRLQHQVAERYNLNSRSRGKDPYRRVEILPIGRH